MTVGSGKEEEARPISLKNSMTDMSAVIGDAQNGGEQDGERMFLDEGNIP